MRNGLIVDEFGNKYWHKDDLYHREDGPAVEFANGNRYWYYQGQNIDCHSQEQFERLLKLKVFW